MSAASIAIPAILMVLVGLGVTYGCFVLAAFVGRRFETTRSGILLGGLAGMGAFIVINVILSFVMSAVFYSMGAAY